MNNKALVVIDLQNDITKHYKDIIEKVNAAVDWAVADDKRFSTVCANSRSPYCGRSYRATF